MFFGLLLACGSPGAPDEVPPAVEFAGCRQVTAGPVCVARPGDEISVWVPGVGLPPVHVDGEPRELVWTAIDGGQRAEVAVTEPHTLQIMGWSLEMALEQDAPGRAAFAQGDREGALEELRAAEPTLTGAPRVRVLHALSFLRDPRWSTEAVEQAAVVEEAWWWAAREALLIVERVHEQDTGTALAALERARSYRGRAELGGRMAYNLAWYEGLAHHAAGDLRTARGAFGRAIHVARRFGNPQWERESRAMLADTLLMAGRNHEAIAMLEAPSAHRWGDHCGAASRLNSVAWGLLLAHETGATPMPVHERAEALLLRAAEELGKGPCDDPRHDRDAYLAEVYINRALAAVQAGHAEVAANHLIRAEQAVPSLAEPWLPELRGRVQLMQGEGASALATFRAIAASKPPSLEFAWMARRGIGAAHEALGQRERALDSLEEAQALFLEQSVLIPVHLGRAAYLGQREALAARAARLHLARGQGLQALDTIRTFRAQYMHGLYQTSRVTSESAAAPIAWRAALDDFRAAQAQLAALPQAEDVPRDRAAEVAQQREAARDARAQAVDRADAALGVRLSAARRRAKPGELLLLWAELSEGWVGFAETERGVLVHRYGAAQPEGAGWLLPWGREIRAAQEVVALPLSHDHTLAVHALPFDGRPLVDRLPVSYRLDLAPLGALDISGPAAVVADPTGNLAGARKEAARVSEALHARGWAVESLGGARAARASVLAAMEGLGWLHYSGHAVAADAWGSSLALADGRIDVADILMLPHTPRVVVLNACETAGQATPSSLGLAQAFTAAGSQAVLATDEPVPDTEASAFSAALYEALASDETLPEAYVSAVRALRTAHPQGAWHRFRLLRP